MPQPGGVATGDTAWGFLAVLVAAFAAYVVGLALVRRRAPATPSAVAVAVVVQLVPLAAPLLLSTDAWTYWAYGWIGAEGGGNPYVDPPAAFPESPALPYAGSAWTDTTTVYGPALTLVSEAVARVAGGSEDAAAWLFKTMAFVAMLAAIACVTRAARRPALAAALVGWNPVVAVHAAGGGHNDALVSALAAGAVALAANRRESIAGAAWALAGLVKWIPLAFLALAVVGQRARSRPTGVLGAAIATLAFSSLAVWRYGLEWLAAARPLVDNARRETSYAFPSRLEEIGLPDGVALAIAVSALVLGGAWLAREALHGRVWLGRAACLVLVTTPYLAVWYLAWALPLAAVDDDRVAKAGVLVLTAYLLPQTIPL